MKSCDDTFSRIITRLANLSFTEGRFPSRYKTTHVLPLLKKQGADRSSPTNYRPISNLPTISKVLERLSLMQPRSHLLGGENFCPLQSAYRAGHSTKTALVELLNGVYTAGEKKQNMVVVGLDISAAFDTICHDMLLERINAEFRVSSVASNWLASYLADCKQFVKIGQHSSPLVSCPSGVP